MEGKKKNGIVLKVTAVVLAILLVIGTAAGTSFLVGRRVQPASTAAVPTAYDLAVQNGYKGDLEQWLMSLVGETGAAGKNGASALGNMHIRDFSHKRVCTDAAVSVTSAALKTYLKHREGKRYACEFFCVFP